MLPRSPVRAWRNWQTRQTWVRLRMLWTRVRGFMTDEFKSYVGIGKSFQGGHSRIRHKLGQYAKGGHNNQYNREFLRSHQARHHRDVSQRQPRIPPSVSLAIRFHVERSQIERWRAYSVGCKISRGQAPHLQCLAKKPCLRSRRKRRLDLSQRTFKIEGNDRMPLRSHSQRRNR